MNRKLKNIKVTFVLLILLSSVFLAILPSTSAQLGVGIESQIVFITDNEDLEPDFDPLSGLYYIDVTVQLKYYGTAFGWSGPAIGNQGVHIDLNAESDVDWFTATLSQNEVVLQYDDDKSFDKNLSQQKITISVKVDEYAPAFDSDAVINLIAKSSDTNVPLSPFYIKKTQTERGIQFDPGYLASINPIMDTYYKRVSPEQTADFKLSIENLGNAKTEITFSVESIEPGWTISLPSTKIVDSKYIAEGNNMITIPITVQPPKTFGYHDERDTIKITMTPAYFAKPGDPDYVGKTYEALITVESRGFAFGTGFELILIILVIILVIVAIVILKKYYLDKKGK